MFRIYFLFFIFLNWAMADNIAQIKNYIQNAYEKKYKAYSFLLSDVLLVVSPRISLEDYHIQSISLDSKNLNRNDGVLILNVVSNHSLLKLPLGYQIVATIGVYRSSEVIKSAQNITQSNTTQDVIAFEKFSQMPITLAQLGHVSAKSYMPPNTIITQEKIRPQILIHKKDSFVGIVRDSNIHLETILIARQNGSLGDVIEAFNPQTKRILRVKIIAEGKGEVQ